MTSTAAAVPPLDKGVLWLYRAAWLSLAAAALFVHVTLLLQPAMQPAVLVLRLVKAGVIFGVATILFRRRQRDPVAALLCLAFLLWSVTSSVDFSSDDLLSQVLDRVRFLLFALALLLFPDGEWRPAWTRHVAAASLAVTLIGLAEAAGALATRLFLPLAIACVVAAVATLLHRFRSTGSEVLRQQMKWIAFGLVSGITLILAARSGAALFQRSPTMALPVAWEALFQLGIIAIAFGFLVSLLRYRLFDAEAAISRSAAFAGLTVAVVAVFAGTEATIEMIGQAYLGMGIGDISAAMAAAIAAVLLNPLHDRISSWAEQRFQRDLVLLKRELPELLADTSASLSTRQIGALALPRICEAVHAAQAVLLVGDSVIATEGIDRRAARRRGRFALRLDLEAPPGAPSLSLLLGPRPDGSLHGKEDVAAVREVLPALRRELFAARQRERDRASSNRTRRTLSKQVADLSGRLQRLESGAEPSVNASGRAHLPPSTV